MPVELPDAPYDAMRLILTAEGAAAFDELTRSDRDRELVQQSPATGRTPSAGALHPGGRLHQREPARTQAMMQWARSSDRVDVIVTPTGAAGLNQLTATNLTGHPAVILPHGFRDDGTPVSLTFLGKLFGEADMLRVAHAYQQATSFHLKRPAKLV